LAGVGNDAVCRPPRGKTITAASTSLHGGLTSEQWAEDASDDVAREIMRSLDLSSDELLPSPLEEYVERHP